MKNLLSKWPLLRLFRLIFGGFLAYEAFRSQQWFLVVFALFFLLQAIFNMGCCGNTNCEIPKKTKHK